MHAWIQAQIRQYSITDCLGEMIWFGGCCRKYFQCQSHTNEHVFVWCVCACLTDSELTSQLSLIVPRVDSHIPVWLKDQWTVLNTEGGRRRMIKTTANCILSHSYKRIHVNWYTAPEFCLPPVTSALTPLSASRYCINLYNQCRLGLYQPSHVILDSLPSARQILHPICIIYSKQHPVCAAICLF